MYIRAKRKKTTLFLHVDPTDTILEVKQRIQELLQQVLERLPLKAGNISFAPSKFPLKALTQILDGTQPVQMAGLPSKRSSPKLFSASLPATIFAISKPTGNHICQLVREMKWLLQPQRASQKQTWLESPSS